jgi:hypothetical protein
MLEMIRMDQTRFKANQKLERTRVRWLEDVENNLPELKVTRWRQKVNIGEEWAPAVKDAEVLRGPHDQRGSVVIFQLINHKSIFDIPNVRNPVKR